MRNWWKALTIILLLYTIIGGLLIPVPKQVILYESIRNLYFHVPMWFSMIFLFLMSVIYSIKGLYFNDLTPAEYERMIEFSSQQTQSFD